MCYGCWEEAGFPKFDSPKIREAARLVTTLYEMPDGGVGGNLHIVTDDWNLETEHLEWCRDHIVKGGNDWIESEEQRILEMQILELMLPMTEAERFSVLAFEAGYWCEAEPITIS